MTPIARAVIILGVSLFTLGTLCWIIQGNWQWFAGGAAIFLGTLIAGGVLSVEVKHPQRTQREAYREPKQDTQESEETNEIRRPSGEDLWAPDPD